MAIKWKKRFNPEPVLGKIDASRSIAADGRASFSGLDLHRHIPVISSMLDFPRAAARLNKSSLIWSGLARAEGGISRTSFLAAINIALRKELSTRTGDYVLSSSLSLSRAGVPTSIKVLGAAITFHPNGFSRRYRKAREKAQQHKLPIADTPSNYLPVRVRIRDTSPQAGAQQAIDRLDLLRGLLALHVNLSMQITFGGPASFEPINLVRCGGAHVIHKVHGDLASDAVWFEPNFRPARLLSLKHPQATLRAVRLTLRRIASISYGSQLVDAIIRAARALDEPDSNVAFIKLWAALELLTTPTHADYNALVRRCAFLYEETDYHVQVLEHLREYRNTSVHSGVEGEDARINCFLLQAYFRAALRFYISHALVFDSLMEAHEFLDLPPDRNQLTGKMETLRLALRFVGPQAKS